MFFNRLEIIQKIGFSVAPSGRKRTIVEVKCHCGKIFYPSVDNVMGGGSKSCGCLRDKSTRERATIHGATAGRNKGMGAHYLYNLWIHIKGRCFQKSFPRYNQWGGRGITMYDHWVNNYPLFKSDILSLLGDRPTPQHSLDRIDNDGNYVPENIRWATPQQQMMNRRISNVTIEDVLEIKWLLSLAKHRQPDIADDYKVSRSTISRINTGKSYSNIKL